MSPAARPGAWSANSTSTDTATACGRSRGVGARLVPVRRRVVVARTVQARAAVVLGTAASTTARSQRSPKLSPRNDARGVPGVGG
eukprot:2834077-Rhodomonas_salina.3